MSAAGRCWWAWRFTGIYYAVAGLTLPGLGGLAVTLAEDGDDSAAQGAGAGFALLMFCPSLLKRLREERK